MPALTQHLPLIAAGSAAQQKARQKAEVSGGAAAANGTFAAAAVCQKSNDANRPVGSRTSIAQEEP